MTLQINTSTGARALTADEQTEARTGLGAEASGAGASAVAAHVALADPHTGKYAAPDHTHALLMTTDERAKLGDLPAAADLTESLAGKATSAQGAKADSALQPGAQLTQAAVTSATAAGVAMLSGADAAAQRATLGLGTAATAASTSFATAAQGAKADAALPGSADALADLLEGAATTAPADLARVRYSVSGARQFMPAWNRQNFQRRQSAAAPGFNLFTDRWHRSAPVDIDWLVAYWYAGYQNSTGGLTAIGNDLTVACAVMYPTASSPGAAKAFRKGGATTITVKDGEWVQSDPLSIYLPANTPIRLRSYVAPGAAGFIPYGTPCLGAGNGGSLSGFGAQNDRSSYASGQTDITQNSTNVTTNNTNDTAYEPIVIARPAGYVRTWALFGDSRTFGSGEVGAGSGGTTVAGAGDVWGNVGMWERAVAINSELALNLGISGSILNTWATDGYSSFLMMVGQSSCSSCIIALGTNDTLSSTAEAILANLQKTVNKARCLGFGEIKVPTLPPRTTSSNAWADAAGQTIDAVRSPRITTLNGYLRAGQLVGATIIDQAALVQDATDPQKWRTDLGFVSTTDGVHESKDLIVWLAPQLAALM